jgi:tetratricopeptide (TPR) repeat protein
LNDRRRLIQATDLLKKGLVLYPDDGRLLHTLGFAYYRQLATATDDAVRELTKQANDALERAQRTTDIPETQALRALVLSRMMTFQPEAAMTLGREASESMAKAVRLGPKNPRVWLLHGIYTLYTPEAYGGGLKKAIEYLTESERLFQSDETAGKWPSWGAEEVYAWLGIAFKRSGDKEKAVEMYKKAMTVEPRFGWVRYVLMRELKQ